MKLFPRSKVFKSYGFLGGIFVFILTLCMLCNFHDFFEKKTFFKKFFQEHYQFGYDLLSGLIWVQTVCTGYQQMTKLAAGKEKVLRGLDFPILITYLRILLGGIISF